MCLRNSKIQENDAQDNYQESCDVYEITCLQDEVRKAKSYAKELEMQVRLFKNALFTENELPTIICSPFLTFS